MESSHLVDRTADPFIRDWITGSVSVCGESGNAKTLGKEIPAFPQRSSFPVYQKEHSAVLIKAELAEKFHSEGRDVEPFRASFHRVVQGREKPDKSALNPHGFVGVDYLALPVDFTIASVSITFT